MSDGKRTTWNFYSAGELVFGTGAVRQLGALVARRQLKRVLVITDPALVRAGVLDRVRESLLSADRQVEVFEGGAPEPSVKIAEAAIAAARQVRPDAILGLGGGSNMDLAKVTSAVLMHQGSPLDYINFDRVPGPVYPLICVPTTAGTGSEVSHAAVLTDTDNQMKVSTLSNWLRPMLAVVDPALTLTCPRQATADSGIDALTHAIEAFTAVDSCDLDVPAEQSVPYSGRHVLGDSLATTAIELIGRHLVTAVREPQNLAAREGMSLAATLAGLAFSNCAVALVHALEYPLGGALHVSHGAGNGLLLPYVMRYNLPTRTGAFARVAALLGANTAGMSEGRAAEQAIATVEQLRREIGIPQRIREIGGTAEQLPAFAEKSFGIKRLMLLNPRRPTQEDLLAILQAAL